MATYYSVFTVTPTWHTLSLWSALCCLLVSSAVSVANRLAKLLLQTITKELTLQCATRRGFCEVFSFHWLVSHNNTSLSTDPIPVPPIITNTVSVMCDAAWAYLLSGHWTNWLTGFFILLQFWEDKDIMDSRKWCEQCTNTSRLIDYYTFRDSIHWILK